MILIKLKWMKNLLANYFLEAVVIGSFSKWMYCDILLKTVFFLPGITKYFELC